MGEIGVVLIINMVANVRDGGGILSSRPVGYLILPGILRLESYFMLLRRDLWFVLGGQEEGVV